VSPTSPPHDHATAVSCVAVPAKVDLFEINKVFVSVAIHPMCDLDISSVVVNVNGGAIAMGHPPASSTSTYQPEKAAQLRLAL
jgi:acetyl-CoA C-acetyltransferase